MTYQDGRRSVWDAPWAIIYPWTALETPDTP